MRDDELRDMLESLDYPFKNTVVMAGYEITGTPKKGVVVTYQELINTRRDPMTTEDGGLEPGPTDVSYQIDVYARDSVAVAGGVAPRDIVTYETLSVIAEQMFRMYGFLNDDMSPSLPIDTDCNVQGMRFSGVIDNHNCTYTR